MDLRRDKIMIIGIPPVYHKTLSKWAAERNWKNMDNQVTAETMAVEAICKFIDEFERIEANLKPTDENAEAALAVPGRVSADCSQTKGSLSSPDNRQE